MTLLLDILYSEYFRQNYQKNYTCKLERARELEQHRTSTNPILFESAQRKCGMKHCSVF